MVITLSFVVTYQLTDFDVSCLKTSLTVYYFQLQELLNELKQSSGLCRFNTQPGFCETPNSICLLYSHSLAHIFISTNIKINRGLIMMNSVLIQKHGKNSLTLIPLIDRCMSLPLNLIGLMTTLTKLV